ncbi:TIGR00341 family protein [soil metagenome]
MNDLFKYLLHFLKERFSLAKDKEDEAEIKEGIRRGVEFRGVNIWVLIFAVLLASVGLNVNSTAVIIGAMLVSPLMGPIMGVGLGLGIFDFELVKHAAKNLAIMVVISLLTSVIYFSLSPLNQAQSELLSRTTPTIWDVLIAFSGGLAGIIAGSSREKGNVIAGVAIATALMPPLCTAGFGIARGDFYFFAGAFYLFCINAVFISVSTFVVVRILKFTKQTYVDKKSEKRIKNIVSVIVFVTIVPSLFIAYLTVKKAVFEQRAISYIKTEFQFANTQVLNKTFDYEKNSIDITLIGEKIPEDSLVFLKKKTSSYNLSDVKVNVRQGLNDLSSDDVNSLRAGIINDVIKQNESQNTEKNQLILDLENRLINYQKEDIISRDISQELKALNKNIEVVSLSKSVYYNTNTNSSDTIMTAYAKFNKRPTKSETTILQNWLKARTKSDTLKLIIE